MNYFVFFMGSFFSFVTAADLINTPYQDVGRAFISKRLSSPFEPTTSVKKTGRKNILNLGGAIIWFHSD
jgi:hypothetical protein